MRLLPVSQDALLVELDDLDQTLALFDALQADPLPGVIELVPAARTVLVGFDPAVCRQQALAAAILARRGGSRRQQGGSLLQLPVRYDGEDLAEMAAHLGLTVAELVRRHAACIWQVAFTGFAPGFAYMRGDDAIFDVPRRSSPRTKIPTGSVALAGRFCGIYPRETPGGWQLLGTTPVSMWDLSRQPPALLQPGQRVQFVDLDSDAGQVLAQQWQDPRQMVSVRRDGHAGGASADPAAAPPADAGVNPAAVAVVADAAGQEGLTGAAQVPAPSPDAASAQADARESEGTEVFEVLATGLQALFQDLGRPGQAGQGVSASGALDRGAVRAANRLVGNVREAAVLELLHGGFSVRVLAHAEVAVTGASGALLLRHADGTDVPAERQQVLALDAGDVLTIGAPETGLRSYLAVRGGFAVTPVLGSRATDTLAGIGPAALVAGQRLRAGRQVAGAVLAGVQPAAMLPRPGDDPVQDAVLLDVVAGPRTDWFDDESVALLQTQPWQVTAQSSRVGLRLSGERPLQRIPAMQGVELPSEGTALGAIQVPGNGQPVLFLADHPLTGGYPVIGCVAPHHIDLAGQLPAGTWVRFRLLAPFAEIVPDDGVNG